MDELRKIIREASAGELLADALGAASIFGLLWLGLLAAHVFQ